MVTPRHTSTANFSNKALSLALQSIAAAAYRVSMFVRAAPVSALANHARAMSASAKVWINKDTRVICQGFTGKQVRPSVVG